jgi:hypothetical protein
MFSSSVTRVTLVSYDPGGRPVENNAARAEQDIHMNTVLYFSPNGVV